MGIRRIGALSAIIGVVVLSTSRAGAEVDLELRVDPQPVQVGDVVAVDLYAIWDGVGDPTISVLDMILEWTPEILDFQRVTLPVGGPFPPGFRPSDGESDGLNDSLLDGDLFYVLQSFVDVEVPAEGVLVVTLEFNVIGAGDATLSLRRRAACAPRSLRCVSGDNFGLACIDESDCPGDRRCVGGMNESELCTSNGDCPEGLCPANCSGCHISSCCSRTSVCSFCSFAETRVLFGVVDKTGVLSGTTVTTAENVSLSAASLTMAAGSVAPAVVSGAIFGESASFVLVAVEIVPRDGADGIVSFTEALVPADVDIESLGDPWPLNTFQAFDTDPPPGGTGSPFVNGSFHDIGVATAVTFVGPLTRFPITATADARGVWDLLLMNDTDSEWVGPGLDTDLSPGTITVVAPHDRDGSGRVDLKDFSFFTRCYTSDVGSVDPPAYPSDPELACRVFDLDEFGVQDGDVDEDDLAAFLAVMIGP